MIRPRVPDKFRALSILAAAETEMRFIRTLPPSKESASVIIRTIYEAFRMLGNALLIARGKEATGTEHHTEMINELFTLNVRTKRPIQLLSNLKDLRHRINYQGYLPNEEEAEDARSMATACFQSLLIAVRNEVKRLG